MKTIGLIGGMSWESTATYYQLLNELARQQLGGLHSAELLLWSFDFAEIEALQAVEDWTTATARMVEAAQRLAAGGAECLLICTNTMHKMADAVQTAVGIPLLHIADATAVAVQQAGLSRVGLLGTRYTMEQPFYKGRLTEKYGLDVLIPEEPGRTQIHDIIYDELCQGIIRDKSKQQYRSVIELLLHQGAEGIILGCTEIGLLIQQEDVAVSVFDTTSIHAAAALEFAMGGLATDAKPNFEDSNPDLR
ncbi:MAG: aspartate/glutamate racemase family protein [Cyanobacteria bacterium P01_G01_bin.38]